jgi:large subunit ribosomal protein L22
LRLFGKRTKKVSSKKNIRRASRFRLHASSSKDLLPKREKMEALAKLKNYPTSPRKMRLLADEIRGLQVEKALALLEHHPQHSSTPLYKLLWSAVKNWEAKNEGKSAADSSLLVKTIFVDGARVLKRMRPAPQGRGYRVRKRSNHVTLIVDEKK